MEEKIKQIDIIKEKFVSKIKIRLIFLKNKETPK